MKQYSFFWLILLFSASTFASFAQEETTVRESIFDSLEKSEPGKGTVVIHQSESIRRLVGAPQYGVQVENSNGASFLVFDGFRVQVFSGNNQRLSREEASQKEKEIKELLPELSAYITFDAPFWKLRVGDFRTHEEAYHLLRELTTAFPAYGKEMYIVNDKVRIPIY
ncbi:SPOR domain-containing protein [Parabacteroides sp. OttesenSCG-928-O15]|nr:SPOR domain-containing protein [Parabacteroides sp. OttesenSCG-928-O15]